RSHRSRTGYGRAELGPRQTLVDRRQWPHGNILDRQNAVVSTDIERDLATRYEISRCQQLQCGTCVIADVLTICDGVEDGRGALDGDDETSFQAPLRVKFAFSGG